MIHALQLVTRCDTMPLRNKLPIGIQTFAIIRGEPYALLEEPMAQTKNTLTFNPCVSPVR